jgi:hypothetical protein
MTTLILAILFGLMAYAVGITAIEVPLAGIYIMKIEGFPVLEQVSFNIDGHDQVVAEDLLMGVGTSLTFGAGSGSIETKEPQAQLIPWESMNGQPPMNNVAASFEPIAGIGSCFDLQNFYVINCATFRQDKKAALSRPIKIGWASLTPR